MEEKRREVTPIFKGSLLDLDLNLKSIELSQLTMSFIFYLSTAEDGEKGLQGHPIGVHVKCNINLSPSHIYTE